MLDELQEGVLLGWTRLLISKSLCAAASVLAGDQPASSQAEDGRQKPGVSQV